MKKVLYFIIVLTTLYLSGCKSDSKDDPLAPSAADERDQFVGTWLCNETSKSLPATAYTITISKSTTNSTDIIINKFYDLLTQARATVNSNKITIPYQSLTGLGFASGTGTLSASGNNLYMNYIVKISSNDNDTCTANCVKQ